MGVVILYRAFSLLGFRPFMRTVLRLEIRGAEHVPASGPAILAANHESIWDPFVLGVITTRPVHYMAKAELWRLPPVRWAMEGFGAFPVERGGGDLAALRHGVSLLEQGEVLGVFPQGTSKLSPPRRFHRGAARLALATGAPIVPVRLLGTRGVLRPGLPRVTIEAAPPLRVEPGPATIAAAREVTAALEQVLTRPSAAET